jgi:deoxycytidylate deaminase
MDDQEYTKNKGFTKLPDLSIKFESLDEEILYFQDPIHYEFIENDNKFIEASKQAAIDLSLTSIFPIGIVAEKDGQIIARAGNGNGYHEKNLDTPGHRKGCIRRYLNDEREKVGLEKFKGGEGFELCPGCHTDSHAEANLIKESKILNKYNDLNGANVYMYGHFWCCKDCWQKMIEAGIKKVYLPNLADGFKDKEFVKKWSEEVESKKVRC